MQRFLSCCFAISMFLKMLFFSDFLLTTNRHFLIITLLFHNNGMLRFFLIQVVNASTWRCKAIATQAMRASSSNYCQIVWWIFFSSHLIPICLSNQCCSHNRMAIRLEMRLHKHTHTDTKVCWITIQSIAEESIERRIQKTEEGAFGELQAMAEDRSARREGEPGGWAREKPVGEKTGW